MTKPIQASLVQITDKHELQNLLDDYSPDRPYLNCYDGGEVFADVQQLAAWRAKGRITTRIQAMAAADDWQPIDTAPKDGTDILTWVDCATVPVVHIAYWWDGENWDMCGHDSRDEAVGWWSYVRHSVTQEKLDGHLTPTHWTPYVPPTDRGCV